MNYLVVDPGSVRIECVIPFIKSADVVIVYVGTSCKRPRVEGVGCDLLSLGDGGEDDRTNVRFGVPEGFEYVASDTSHYGITLVFAYSPGGALHKAVEAYNEQGAQ